MPVSTIGETHHNRRCNVSTDVLVSATFLVNNKPVIVKSDSLKEGMKFAITEPVVLGSPKDFVEWLNTEFAANIELPQPGDETVKTWPNALQTAYNDFYNGNVSIDVLSIDSKLGQYQFGISYELKDPLPLIADLKFDKVGVVIKRQPTFSTLQADISSEELKLNIPHGDETKFNANKDAAGQIIKDTIKIDDEQMKVEKAEPGSAESDPAVLTVIRSGTTVAHKKDAYIVVIDTPKA